MSDSDDEYLPSDDEEIDVVADDERGADYVDFDEEDFVFLEAEVDLPPPTETEALALAHEYALCSDESDAGAPEAMETNLLYKACVEGNATDAQALLAVGALPDAPSTDPSEDGKTPLIAAASHGYLQLVQLLLQPNYKVSVDTRDSVGYTPLLWACVKGHLPVVDALIAAGANVNLANKFGDTPLIKAVENNHFSVVTRLISCGAAVNAANVQRQTALHKAARVAPVGMVGALLAARANPNAYDKNGNTPLILAAESGSVAVVKELLRAGAVVDNVNNFGHPAVLRAARKGHLLVVQMLLEVGADFDEDFLNDPMIKPTLIPLLKRGADVSKKWRERWEALTALWESHNRFIASSGLSAAHIGGFRSSKRARLFAGPSSHTSHPIIEAVAARPGNVENKAALFKKIVSFLS